VKNKLERDQVTTEKKFKKDLPLNKQSPESNSSQKNLVMVEPVFHFTDVKARIISKKKGVKVLA